jgi:hypothetical protein
MREDFNAKTQHGKAATKGAGNLFRFGPMRANRIWMVLFQSASRRRAGAALWRAAKAEGLAQSKTLREIRKS